jgi:hypothetical protein
LPSASGLPASVRREPQGCRGLPAPRETKCPRLRPKRQFPHPLNFSIGRIACRIFPVPISHRV